MFKIKQKYTDFEGHVREEDLYFNFTEPQMRELIDNDPSFTEQNLANLMVTRDAKQMLTVLQKLIVAAYGEKSADGKVFKKNKEITENFECSAAFAQLMDDLMYRGDVDTIKKFFINIFPAKFAETLKEQIDNAQIETVTGEVIQ